MIADLHFTVEFKQTQPGRRERETAGPRALPREPAVPWQPHAGHQL